MKYLIFFINFVLLFLSIVGDFILFYLKTVYWIITQAYNLVKNFCLAILNFSSSFFKNLNNNTRLNLFKFKLSIKAIKRKLSRKRKNLAKIKKKEDKNYVTIYPAPKHRFLKLKYFILGFTFCFFLVSIPIYFYFFLNTLPNPKQLSERQIPQTTKIYDRNGKFLYQIYANENRTLVPLNSIPKHLVNATIAIEDKDFYKNPGFDLNGIIRAAIADLSGKPIQGGSTITQQLIKTTLLTPEVTIERKIKELILAFWAEKIYNKNEILEMYFNQIPYGGTAWGVEAAAETYFGKKVRDLDLAQSAFLAGMPQAPSDYSPYGESPTLWKTRQKDVLGRMLALKYITKEEYNSALNQSLVFKAPQIPIYAPHFVMYIKELLIQKYGIQMVEKGGLNIITSLDLDTQNTAQEIVKEEVDNNAYLNLTNGAALITNPKNGDIVAMVGSKDYNDPNGGNVNLTTALRQPGSSIKLVTYAAALSNGFTAATIIDDSPVTYTSPGAPSYSPVNYDGAFHGKVPLRIAFANSFNIPAVKTLAKIGIPTMVDMGKKMGITTWKDPSNYGLSITLGAAEVKMTDLATVYGTVANQGRKIELNPILEVKDYQGNIIYKKTNIISEKILDPAVAYIISNILADNNARSWEFGSNSPLNIPNHVVSVKTGTTDNKRDNWTVGYTPSHLVAVWVGNNDNSPMSPYLASGITGAAPIWNRLIISLLPNANEYPTKLPENLISKRCYGKIEYFVKGTENLDRCNNIATPSGAIIR